MRALLLAAALLSSALAGAQFYGYKDAPVPGQARVATTQAGADVRVDQKLGDFVPLDATFRDELGHTVKLGELVGDKPVVLLPVFYKCAGICETELMNLVGALKRFKKHFVGKDFDVVVLGIDPKETPQMAASKKDTMVALYMGARTDRSERVQAERGWHFLTGEMKQIRRVTDSIGYRFTYDERNGSIVHPSGLVVLTRAGKISRYFLDMDYPQRLLLDSILLANTGDVGERDDRPFFMACIQIDPLSGQRSLNVLNVLKTLGVVTIVGMATAMLIWNRQRRGQNPAA